jgi:hypothetical protein
MSEHLADSYEIAPDPISVGIYEEQPKRKEHPRTG